MSKTLQLIGQVYKGTIIDKPTNQPKPVAVKVMHPSVEDDIDADLDLMRLFVRGITKVPFFTGLKWLNMEGAVEEFAELLKLQLDCRVEAANLERFNQNFATSEHVVFPKLIEGYEPSKDVLIETFVEGVPVMQFAREHRDDEALLHEMCIVAIENVCKMIFLDNFIHGMYCTGINIYIGCMFVFVSVYFLAPFFGFTVTHHSIFFNLKTKGDLHPVRTTRTKLTCLPLHPYND